MSRWRQYSTAIADEGPLYADRPSRSRTDFSYIAERNRAAAIALRERIDLTVAALGEIPEMAQAADEPGVRRMPIRSYPYVIFYTIEAEEVVVLHVRHGARRAPWDIDA